MKTIVIARHAATKQSFLVIAGLDPAIHPLEWLFRSVMDARVKPAHDEGG
jgi:hypothetical protein